MMKEISSQFFDECPQLHIIETPYRLQEIFQQSQKRDKESQFELLRALTQTKKHKLKLRMNSILENKRNRYPQQSIYQGTRIKLKHSQQPNKDQYFNANFIDHCKYKRLIITQGPLQSTSQHFYKVIQQQKVECVLMLCGTVENNKDRCFDYLSMADHLGKKLDTQQLAVNLIKYKGYSFTHIYYKVWPDRGIPSKTGGIEEMLKQAMKFNNILIHCSAGLGRSGVIASLISILAQSQQGLPINIFKEVRKLRESRFQSVQNNQQYKFIYQYLIQHVKKSQQ